MVRILIHLALIFLRLMPLFILYTALYRDPGHQALKKAGFTGVTFRYPVPDYKLPFTFARYTGLASWVAGDGSWLVGDGCWVLVLICCSTLPNTLP